MKRLLKWLGVLLLILTMGAYVAVYFASSAASLPDTPLYLPLTGAVRFLTYWWLYFGLYASLLSALLLVLTVEGSGAVRVWRIILGVILALIAIPILYELISFDAGLRNTGYVTAFAVFPFGLPLLYIACVTLLGAEVSRNRRIAGTAIL